MKKLIALTMALVMLCALAACGGKTEPPATEAPTEPPVVLPASALEIMENTWALFGDDEKFPSYGGDMDNMVDGAPGVVDPANTDTLCYQLLIPEDQVQNVDDAASLNHGMLSNNFTGGAFHVTSDAAAFADAMVEVLKNNHWLCGAPQSMLVATIGSEYVVMAYGNEYSMPAFLAHFQEAYPDAVIVNNDPIY